MEVLFHAVILSLLHCVDVLYGTRRDLYDTGSQSGLYYFLQRMVDWCVLIRKWCFGTSTSGVSY